MKISAQEEYGLRILVQLAKSENGLSISEIANKENLSISNTAKFCRLLRNANYIKSEKGKEGGYKIIKTPEEISLTKLIQSLDPPLYGETFCDKFCKDGNICVHTTNCSVKNVWIKMQAAIESSLEGMTLKDLL